MRFISEGEFERRLAYAELSASVATHRQRQCERCAAQWKLHPRYGWALSPHTLFGCESFVCPDCQRRTP
jgi:hypothetical protein